MLSIQKIFQILSCNILEPLLSISLYLPLSQIPSNWRDQGCPFSQSLNLPSPPRSFFSQYTTSTLYNAPHLAFFLSHHTNFRFQVLYQSQMNVRATICLNKEPANVKRLMDNHKLKIQCLHRRGKLQLSNGCQSSKDQFITTQFHEQVLETFSRMSRIIR